MVAAFAAVARHQGAIGGRVKITAVEELAGSDGRAVAGPGPQPGTVNLLAFPAGGCTAGRTLNASHPASLAYAC